MLAIIIPYYKLVYFEETLQSLASQIDKRFKVYIGDDASPEPPLALLEKYKGQFDFVYHRFEANLGGTSLTQQWERCITLSANQEWLMILGDDDYLDIEVVASWHKNYDTFNTKSSVVRFATKIVNQKSGKISEAYLQPKREKATDSYFRKLKGLTRSSLSEYVFSKESFLSKGFSNYPLAWHSDDKAWIDFSENKPIYSINEAIVFVRISSSSITGKLDNEDVKNGVSIQFLKDLILKKSKAFEKAQLIELLLEYERAIKKSRKLNLKEWLFLMPFYLKYFKLTSFLKYCRRFLISIFNL
ncbi:glycosyltransferase family 2 protein [Flavobacterium yafengii]|uniref:Glycosyltransferase family 2 protein n=1 Tax=Flavobacterium yafengii TaxID=3041253 RepID=A0AAW6TM68_9FLAO|nr:glycosyltransferase family 2 protein [Flavobacterium yafengii]MDI5950695.1 glycosyltransferase family 2 protein [Flavobacterium yafengii]